MILVSGIAVVDLIASGLPHVARPGELVFGSIRVSLGGHACNVSVDLAQLGFPKSRLRVVFPAGRDVFGPFGTMSAAQAPSTGWTPSLQPS